MKIFDLLNQKLETIKFSNKTKLLIFIILSGTMTIGFLMFVSIFALKYDYETLFQKHTQPQVELEEIKDIYRINITETLHDIKDEQITSNDAIEVIFLAQQITAKQWEIIKNLSILTSEDCPILPVNGSIFSLFHPIYQKKIFFNKVSSKKSIPKCTVSISKSTLYWSYFKTIKNSK